MKIRKENNKKLSLLLVILTSKRVLEREVKSHIWMVKSIGIQLERVLSIGK